MRALLANRGFSRNEDIGRLVYRIGRHLRKAGADAHGRLDAPQEGRAVNDDLEAAALPCQCGAIVCDFGINLCLLQDARNLVADQPRLQETAVREGRIVGCR